MSPEDYHPVLQGFLGTLFTWAMTAAGASLVFFTTKVNKKLMDLFFGFAAGVMISASCFGLIIPSVEIAKEQAWSHNISWLPAVLGFLCGTAFLKIVSYFFDHHHAHGELEEIDGLCMKDAKTKELEEKRQTEDNDTQKDNLPLSLTTEESAGIERPMTRKKRWFSRLNRLLWGDSERHSSWHKTLLLVFAITLHNFPEGLAVGVAFGAVESAENKSRAFSNAVALAIGIGIQDFPEGLGVSMPLRRAGMSRTRSFLHGQASGLVEPIGGIIGAAAVLVVKPLLPFALSFAAGAMMFVVIEELIPESQRGGNKHVGTLGAVLGFVLMMALDVALG
jgi:zinc transporter ZupT